MDNSMCLEIHKLVNELPAYSYKNIDKEPFLNGIYFLFEKGEGYHELKRIVKVGINREQGNLKKRLIKHFKENHKNSVLIRHIGSVYLSIDNDDYLEYWNNRETKDKNKENFYRTKVNKYIQENITVSVIEVENREIRHRLESAIIATLYNTCDFKQSVDWLGNKSPEAKIKNSGMWIENGLKSDVLTKDEFKKLKGLISKSNRKTF